MVSVHPQPGRDRYKVIVLRTDGSEVLVVPNGTHFDLPEVEIPAFERVAQLLTAAVLREWGQEIVCLFSLPSEIPPVPPRAVSYYVAEALNNQHSTAVSSWVSIESLRQESFADVNDFQALRRSLTRCSSGETNPKQGPFEKLGWLSEARAWISENSEPCRLHLTGPFRQLNASPSFSLIRFETHGPAVWFKAVGDSNLREFRVTRKLGRFFSAFVPRILSVREDWRAWIALEVQGTHPDENSEIEIWTAVGRTLAQLQIASIGSTLHLMDAGCRDARIPALLDLVDPFLDAMGGLMEQQTKRTPPPLNRSELQALARQLKDAFIELEEFKIPDTLGHLDFNPGNIVVSDQRCIFLDWAEACIAHPFITFQYLLGHIRKLHPQNTTWEHTITAVYAQQWRSLISPLDHGQALLLSRLAAVFAFAISISNCPTAASRPEIAPYLRSLTRLMQREADTLGERRLTCIP